MGRFLAYLALLLSLGIYLFAVVPGGRSFLLSSGVIKDARLLGDVYSLSHLADFKHPHPICSYTATKLSPKKKINLFVIGDSYTQGFTSESYSSQGYLFTHWDNQSEISLDTTCTNILILESIERIIWFRFVNAHTDNIVLHSAGANTPKFTENYHISPLSKVFMGVLAVNDNLEAILFGQPALWNIMDYKAYMNEHFFGRINPNAVLSKKKHILYYKDEVNPKEKISSFYPYTEADLSTIVQNMNTVAAAYSRKGFDKVIYSLIPNKSTITESEAGYNGLIPNIQANPNRKFEYMDVYAFLKKQGDAAYLYNDTHWDCPGRYEWLDTVNARLKSIATLE